MPNASDHPDGRTRPGQRRQFSRRQLLSGLAVGGAGLTIGATGAYALTHGGADGDAGSARTGDAQGADVPAAVRDAVSDTAGEEELASSAEDLPPDAAAGDVGPVPADGERPDSTDGETNDETAVGGAAGRRAGHARHR